MNPMLMGAMIGGGSKMISDWSEGPKREAQRTAAAVQTMYSPWTGAKISAGPQDPSEIAGLAEGAAAGMGAGGEYGQYGAQKEKNLAEAAWRRSQAGLNNRMGQAPGQAAAPPPRRQSPEISQYTGLGAGGSTGGYA